MNVGYARVSSKDQNLDRQIAALHDAGVERIFADKQSGKDFERVEYKAMMKRLRADTCFSSSRLTVWAETTEKLSSSGGRLWISLWTLWF